KTRQISAWYHPCEADQNYRNANHNRANEQTCKRFAIPRLEDSRKLQADDDKYEPVQKERDRLPKRIRLQAGPRCDHQRRVPAQEKNACKCRQNGGGMHLFCRQINDKKGEEKEGDLEWGVITSGRAPRESPA